MPKYLYVDDGQFIQGLPAQDLDSDQLSDVQKDTLQLAIGMGIYRLDTSPAAKEATPAEQSRVNDITEMVVNRGKLGKKYGAQEAPKVEEKHEDTP